MRSSNKNNIVFQIKQLPSLFVPLVQWVTKCTKIVVVDMLAEKPQSRLSILQKAAVFTSQKKKGADDSTLPLPLLLNSLYTSLDEQHITINRVLLAAVRLLMNFSKNLGQRTQQKNQLKQQSQKVGTGINLYVVKKIQ